MGKQHLTTLRFAELGLADNALRGLAEAGFEFCTPIQAQTLPAALQGQDIAGQAQTGTGKTAAFLLALFRHLQTHPAKPGRRANQPRALVLAPTRELAIQIHSDAQILGKYVGLVFGLVYGGTGYDTQRKSLEDGVDVLIGTPGRIIDYFKQHVFDLHAAQVVVLDEADRMLDLGFIKDIRFLLRRCPPPEQRLGLLFSATLSHRVTELAYEHMNNPKLIKVETENVTAERVRQVLYHTANDEKVRLLIGLLKHMDPLRTIVFVNTKRDADKVWGYLESNGFSSAILSGDVPQNKRQVLLERFQSGDLPVLVATDVAARGLHIPDVSHVFNYDLPQDAEDYVHRIGRTARLGADGDAISFACETYVYSLPDIETYIGHKIPVDNAGTEMFAELLPPVKTQRPPRRPGSGGNNSRSGPRPGGSGRQRRPRNA